MAAPAGARATAIVPAWPTCIAGTMTCPPCPGTDSEAVGRSLSKSVPVATSWVTRSFGRCPESEIGAGHHRRGPSAVPPHDDQARGHLARELAPPCVGSVVPLGPYL